MSNKCGASSFIKTVCFFTAIMLTMVCFFAINVFADQEAENNDTHETATLIPLGGSVEGNISTKSDIDWYKIVLPGDGYISMSFVHDKIADSDDYWRLVVFAEDGITGFDGIDSPYSIAGNADKTFPDMGLAAGTYYIKLYKGDADHSDKNYKLTVNFTESKYWETEYNNTKETADIIELNQTYSGSLSSRSEIDWYKFVIPKDGCASIKFTHGKISDSDDYWRLVVFGEDGVLGFDGVDSPYTIAGNADKTFPDMGLAAGTYYIKLYKGDDDHSYDTYTLTVDFTESDFWETEYNNTKDTADEISVDQMYKGSLSSRTEIDWYKFVLAEDGYISIDFIHDKIADSDDYWRLRVYRDDGVTHYDGIDTSYTIAGNADRILPSMGLAAGIYYISVEKGDSDHSYNNYSMTVNFTKSELWESEINNSKDTADEINVNSTYNGALCAKSDVDWYKVTLLSAGYVSIAFTHGKVSDSSVHWHVHVFSEDGVTYFNNVDNYYYIKGNEDRTLPDMGLDAGAYYIMVTKGSSHTNLNYELTVNFKESDRWESESNGSKETADLLKINTSYSGAITASADTDWYKMVLSADEEITVLFNHDINKYTDDYWRVVIYNGDGVTKHSEYKIHGNAVEEFKDIKFTSGTYYVKVSKGSQLDQTTYSISFSKKHDCIGSWTVISDPTCSGEGLRNKLCDICAKTLETQVIAANGHNYVSWITDKASSCTESGKRHAECTVCNETFYEEISQLPHIYDSWIVTAEPSCKSEGTRTKFCLSCNRGETEAIAKLEHIFDEWKTVQAATCYGAGSAERTCSVCKEKETKVLEQQGHSYGEWETVSGGLIPPAVKERVCEYCGNSEKIENWSNVWILIAVIAVVIGGAASGVVIFIKRR